jgi:hypothetical protein
MPVFVVMNQDEQLCDGIDFRHYRSFTYYVCTAGSVVASHAYSQTYTIGELENKNGSICFVKCLKIAKPAKTHYGLFDKKKLAKFSEMHLK